MIIQTNDIMNAVGDNLSATHQLIRIKKNSGLEWIGEIPEHWEIVKFKYHLKRRTIKNQKNATILSLYREFGVIPKNSRDDNHNVTSKDISTYLLVRKGDFVVNKMKAWHGSVAVSEYEGIVSPAYYVYEFSTSEIERRYSHYLLRNKCYANEFRRISGGIREGQWDLSSLSLENIPILIPQIPEQKAIADYLDTKCSEIDSICEDLLTEINTLGEYKKSVITEAVTKGLQPDVVMKDSGLEWIGEIPEHWEIVKFKYHLKRRTIKNQKTATILSLYREFGVIPKNSRDDNHNVTSKDISTYLLVRKGDFVVNKMKAWQGSVAVSEYEGIVSPAYYVYEFSTSEIERRYSHYLLRNKCYANEFRRISGGIREGQWDLSSLSLENIPILIPPIPEQKAITDYLDTKCSEIDIFIQKKKEQLTTLEEYKKSIIYEYVTGKRCLNIS